MRAGNLSGRYHIRQVLRLAPRRRCYGHRGKTEMRTLARGALLGLLLSFALSGCGQKGPLFLPEDDEDDEQAEIDGTLTGAVVVAATGAVTAAI